MPLTYAPQKNQTVPCGEHISVCTAYAVSDTLPVNNLLYIFHFYQSEIHIVAGRFLEFGNSDK